MGFRRHLALTTAVLSLAAAGCGDDSSGGGGAVGLTKWLPRDAGAYVAADVSAIKEDLGLEEDAHPFAPFDPSQQVVLQALSAFVPAPVGEVAEVPEGEEPEFPELRPLDEVPAMEAIDPGAITATASAQVGQGADGTSIVVIATTTDTGEVGSALGDLGYRDEGGVLVPARAADGPAVRLDETLIFASQDPEALAAVPDEPAEELPLEVLAEVEDFPDVTAYAFSEGCVRERAEASDAGDGRAEIVMLVEGDADAARFEPEDSDLITGIETDGSILTAEVEAEPGNADVGVVVARIFPGYDCD